MSNATTETPSALRRKVAHIETSLIFEYRRSPEVPLHVERDD